MPDDPGRRAARRTRARVLVGAGALAAETAASASGSLVSGNLYRHPAVVAKPAATIDHISGGRFVVGPGGRVAAQRARRLRHRALDVGPRLDRFEEACAVITLPRPETAPPGRRRYRITDAPWIRSRSRPASRCWWGAAARSWTIAIASPATPTSGKTPGSADSAVGSGAAPPLHGRGPRVPRPSPTEALVYLSTDEKWLAPLRQDTSGRPRLLGTPAEMAEQVAAYAAAGVDELHRPRLEMGSAAADRRHPRPVLERGGRPLPVTKPQAVGPEASTDVSSGSAGIPPSRTRPGRRRPP